MTFPSSRAYRAEVARLSRLTPRFTRITFTGDQLQHFGTAGLDQRIKLIFPLADGRFTDVGFLDEPPPPITDWYRRWRELPDEDRNPMRTYTVRAVRPEKAEVDIDFVLHGSDADGTSGPASAWAQGARPGDELIIYGPDGRGEDPTIGIEWHPGRARHLLLAGDETAAPAICAILEQLPPESDGLALIEVPTSDDRLQTATGSGVEVRWLPRDGVEHGALLRREVEAWGQARAHGARGEDPVDPSEDEILWDAPVDAAVEEYAWFAGEAGTITGLRRHLVRDLGIDRRSVAFMGYWRIGRAEGS